MRATWGALLLACVACGDDDDVTTTADAPVVVTGDAPPIAIVDARVVDAPRFDALAPPPADAPAEKTFDAPPAPMVDALTNTAPVILSVIITHAEPCKLGTPSPTTVEIMATDAETAASQLTYSGKPETGEACGEISARVTTFTCPQAAPYQYNVSVRDPQDNVVHKSFFIRPCISETL